MSRHYTQKLIPPEVDRNVWPEWATARHLLERLRPYFEYQVSTVTGDTWAKSWSISNKKNTLTLKCKELTADGQKEARDLVDLINSELAKFRVPCPIRIQTDSPVVAYSLFDMMV